MELQSRPLKEHEKNILERLLECDFRGRDELRQQLQFVTARIIDEEGSLALSVKSPIRADTEFTVPVEAEYLDADGIPIWILLHVINGQLNELEFVKADGSTIKNPPRPDLFVPTKWKPPQGTLEDWKMGKIGGKE